jgi:hypothetical protein
MPKQMRGPRKQRTRQHVIADLSLHHVEGFVLETGHTVQSVDSDYGYHLLLFTYDEDGYLEPGLAYMQFKAAESLRAVGAGYVYRPRYPGLQPVDARQHAGHPDLVRCAPKTSILACNPALLPPR